MNASILLVFPVGNKPPKLQYSENYQGLKDAFFKLSEDPASEKKLTRICLWTKNSGQMRQKVFGRTGTVNFEAAQLIEVQQGTHELKDGKLIKVAPSEAPEPEEPDPEDVPDNDPKT